MSEDLRGREAAVPGPSRRGYLDWIRGVAVLIMIEAHVVDSWTAPPDRSGHPFAWAMILGGFGAPLFLLLAGVSVSLSAGSKARRRHDTRGAALEVVRRGLEIFLLAFLFRVQAWILGWASAWTLLRVDILNIMGPAIVVSAVLWGAWRTPPGRVLGFLVATMAMTLLTPIVRIAPSIAGLPDALEAYIRPVPGLTSFTFLPWAGFVFAGALLGVILDGVRPVPPPPGERANRAFSSPEARINLGFAAGGALLALVGYAASLGPSPYARSEFWTTSPSFFLLRLGLLTMAIGLAYAWAQRPGGADRWSPVRQLGRTSLFIYWIHVEMVYGLISIPIHHALTLGQAWIGLAIFTAFMLVCSVAKERAAARWRARRRQLRPSTTPSLS